jgi:quercetin dioxygenase-like cupin family protein
MAFSGQVLDNPISKERFIFHQTSDDTAGALLAFDLVVDPDGRVPGGHVHPVQQESFEILRGTVKFRKGLRTVIAAPGDTVVVPPGAFHQFANAGEEPAVVRVRAARADAPRGRQSLRHPAEPRSPAALLTWEPIGGRPPARDRPAGLRDDTSTD